MLTTGEIGGIVIEKSLKEILGRFLTPKAKLNLLKIMTRIVSVV